MNLSMKWLSDYVDIDVTPRQFSEDMTMSGSKVEGYKSEAAEIQNVVVGRLLSVEQHPNADHLVVCMVDVGEEQPLQICTGAANVKAGDIVPVAKDGSTLPGGVSIHRGELRGVESNGMLCSLGELGLTKGDFPYAIEDGIFLIEEDCQIGQDIASALGCNDTTVEFEITPNRPDCLSVIGLAREAAAILSPAAKKCGFKDKGYLCFEEDAQESVVLRELLDKKLWKVPDRIKDKAAFEENINRSIRQYNPDYWRARQSGIEAAKEARRPRPDREAAR